MHHCLKICFRQYFSLDLVLDLFLIFHQIPGSCPNKIFLKKWSVLLLLYYYNYYHNYYWTKLAIWHCNTREVLKAVKLGNKERLTHNLPSQGALLSFSLDHSLKKLNGIWSGVQSNLPVNIYNFTIKYLSNTLPTRKNLCLWKLR